MIQFDLGRERRNLLTPPPPPPPKKKKMYSTFSGISVLQAPSSLVRYSSLRLKEKPQENIAKSRCSTEVTIPHQIEISAAIVKLRCKKNNQHINKATKMSDGVNDDTDKDDDDNYKHESWTE